MKKTIQICLLSPLLISPLLALDVSNEDRDRHLSVKKAIDSLGTLQTKEVSVVEQFKSMFTDGKVSGQIRGIYAANKVEDGGVSNYATSLGGIIKYELAALNGFNAGFAMTTSQDVRVLTGEGAKQNPELSSSKGNYSALNEAYINYKNENFNFRAGRQVLDTPLADSDDIRMIQNSFDAYIATYAMDSFNFTAGNIQRWQGSDADLDSAWVSTGANGIWLGGLTYSNSIEASTWFYDISIEGESTLATYFDLSYEYSFNENITIHAAIQYLKEMEQDQSGVQADIFGGVIEAVANGFGLNIAYDKSLKIENKRSFSGVGGGALYTSMDTMILDEIANDREVDAIVTGIVYEYVDFSLLYAYGDFNGGANSLGEKAHIAEQNIGFSYNVNDEFIVAAIYAIAQDLQSDFKTEYDFQRAQVMVRYDF